MLITGDRAPDLALRTADGRPVSLGDLLREDTTVLLVFLRHLG